MVSKKNEMTPQQTAALLNLHRGKPSYFGLKGSAARGGHDQVLGALMRKGYVDIEYGKGHVITEEGRGAIRAMHTAARATKKAPKVPRRS